MNTDVPQDKSAREAIGLIVANWSEAAGPVTKEQAEQVNAMLVHLLGKLQAAGFEMPDVSVYLSGTLVHFGRQG